MFYDIDRDEIKGIDVFPKATFRPDVGFYYIVYLLLVDGDETQILYSVDENICRTIQGEPLVIPDNIISRILKVICLVNKDHEIVQLNASGTQPLPEESCTYDKSVYVETLKRNLVQAGLEYGKIAAETYSVEAQQECYYLKEVDTYYYKVNLSKGKETQELIYIVNTDQFKDARKHNVVDLTEYIHGNIVKNIVINNPDYIVIPVRNSDRLIMKDKAEYSRVYENLINRNEMKYLTIKEKNQKLSNAGKKWMTLNTQDKKIQERFLNELNVDDMEKNLFAVTEVKEFMKEKTINKITTCDPETVSVLRELKIGDKAAVRAITNETEKGRRLVALIVHTEIYNKTPVDHLGKEKLQQVINDFKKLLKKR